MKGPWRVAQDPHEARCKLLGVKPSRSAESQCDATWWKQGEELGLMNRMLQAEVTSTVDEVATETERALINRWDENGLAYPFLVS